MREFRVKTEEGAYDIEAHVSTIGQDILVAIWGGERPHIGAVSVAQPRPSLKDPNTTSATASVICLLGHKEDQLVKQASETLASALKTNVVVTAGIHWDNLDEGAIQKVVKNCGILVGKVLERLGSQSV